MFRKNAWNEYAPEERSRALDFARSYMDFLNAAKTEREACACAEDICAAAGFRDLDKVIASGEKLKPGDKVYLNWMGKSFLAFVIGEQPIECGLNILGAHIDSPRIDIKQNPLFEEEGLCYLDTHYYGGIKKYQWLAMPLALHGVIVRKDGSKAELRLGENEDDPVFCITDLLPHLAHEQMEKSAAKFVDGEALNVLIGGEPLKDTEKDAVKAGVLKLLQETYSVCEEDFISAELELVPAGRCRDVGFDRSMILGYGHDDRVCAYPSLMAVAEYEGTPKRTLAAVLTDKEEIGSVGATGMDSAFFENAVAELIALTAGESDLKVRRALSNSRMLSSDVSAGFDPCYAGVFEKKNAAILGQGVCFNKYTGARGKSGASDANAEFMAEVRLAMDDARVCWQTSEIGKVDVGGGGTIAYLCARYGMNVIDCGVPVLSMHAPWEIVSKADLWEAMKGYVAFLGA
ncbi:MAG: aminopeptidase [Clostridiales bacterium]|nr:aminopeptidase [Clostridiales bacterium]